MPVFTDFSLFDTIVGVILLFFLVRGLWIGFVRQLAAFCALVGGYWLAAHYHGEIAPFAARFLENPKLIFIVSFVCIFLVAAMAFGLLGKLLRRVMEITLMGWFDRLLGGGLGLVKGAVVTSLLYMFLASSLSGSNDVLRKSISAPYLELGAAQLQAFINDPRLREYFKPKKSAIEAPHKQGTSSAKKSSNGKEK